MKAKIQRPYKEYSPDELYDLAKNIIDNCTSELIFAGLEVRESIDLIEKIDRRTYAAGFRAA